MPRKKPEGPMIAGCHKGWRDGLVMNSIGVAKNQLPRYKKEIEAITGKRHEFRDGAPVAHSRGERNAIIRARNVLAERMQHPDIKQFHDQDGGYGDA